MKYKIISLFFSSLLSLPCQANEAQDIAHILKGINHFRMQHFKMPLKIDTKLNAIAYTHSKDMANHLCPVGHEGFDKRFANIRQTIANTSQAAENVAAGYRNIDEVVNGWIKSPGHRANILGGYNLTGIAIAYDQNHKPYYTQIFAKS